MFLRGSTSRMLVIFAHAKQTRRRSSDGLFSIFSSFSKGCRDSIVASSRFFSKNQKSTASAVEISPASHGTTPLTSLVDDERLFDKRIRQSLEQQKLIHPTLIQAHAIPLLQQGHDVMASASTGSGKTFMFSLPIVNALLKNIGSSRTSSGPPAALILNPTRELAMQTRTVLQSLVAPHNLLNVGLATGGEDSRQQRKQLSHADILVGTPGRILQFVDERILRLQQMQFVVVDEADRMLDMGFEPQLQRIARALGKNSAGTTGMNATRRQTTLCSATFPLDVQRVASEFLKPSYYFIAAGGRVGGMNSRTSQTIMWVGDSRERRRNLVLAEIRAFQKSNKNRAASRIIVFCNTKDECERLGAALTLARESVRVVTGDKMQAERNKSLAAFRSGAVKILVTTDVSSRGLDVPEIGLVVQAEAPRDVDTFVHRVGRTGRGGASTAGGTAIAMLDGRSSGIACDLVELLHEAGQPIPAWLRGMAHVAASRRMEQEGAIAAGGGGELDHRASFGKAQSAPAALGGEKSNGFTSQDFRSRAEAGSWGSERDTSYHSFDEEAYSRLEAPSTTTSSVDPVDSHDVSGGNIDACVHSEPHFSRPPPSIQLSRALGNISGLDTIGTQPRRDVLRALSKFGSDQRLRFEYLGMFPFGKVVDLLKSPERPEAKNSNGMPRVLMVAEKPSIAKAIADALSGPSGPRQRRGISRALPVYEFTSDRFAPVQGDGEGKGTRNTSLVTVTSVVGHIFSLGFVEETSGNGGKRQQSDPENYFHIPVVKREEATTGKLRVVDHLRALASKSDHLVLWLDCDAEGENIAHEVIGVTRRAFEQKMAAEKASNPNGPLMRRIHRAFFSAITNNALRDAFGNLGEPDAALSRSVDARQELDLRVGVALTRLLTWRCVSHARQRFSPATKVISYGPCQTPTLFFCVDRARDIHGFEPKPYYKVKTTAGLPNDRQQRHELRWKPHAPVENNSKRGKVIEESATFDEIEARSVVEIASDPSSFFRIVRVEENAERVSAPFGLNTVALLSAGSKTMGMSPKQVIGVAEKLYSAGYLSYPRTETTRYDPNGFDVQQILREHANHPEWGRTASHLLHATYSKSRRPPVRGKDAGDHPPITCLKAATREDVGGGAAWRVYEFVVRHFLGSLSADLLYTRRVSQVELCSPHSASCGKKAMFELEHISVDSVGFASACTWVLRDIGAEDGRATTHFLKEGTEMTILEAKVEESSTQPPRFLQEHELIELMDKNRVGTDASMATHVNNIVDRGYVVLCDETGVPVRSPRPSRPGQKRPARQVGRYLVPTPLGASLIDLFGNAGDLRLKDEETFALLSQPAIRSQMEAEVKQIATGELDKEACLQKNLQWFRSRYEQLVGSLSRDRLKRFAASLEPTNRGLRYWRDLGAFETANAQQQGSNSHKVRNAFKKKRPSSKGRTNFQGKRSARPSRRR